jgi:hypothetical protein
LTKIYVLGFIFGRFFSQNSSGHHARNRASFIINKPSTLSNQINETFIRDQGCQMVCFQTKFPNLGKFWRALQLKMLVYFMEIWSISRSSGTYILWTFGIFFPILVFCTKKNLATLFGDPCAFTPLCNYVRTKAAKICNLPATLSSPWTGDCRFVSPPGWGRLFNIYYFSQMHTWTMQVKFQRTALRYFKS